MIKINLSFQIFVASLIIKETESLFLPFLAQRQSVRCYELRLASVEFHEFFFELFARIFQFALVFGVIFLEFLELGVELDGTFEIRNLKKLNE
jgi:hypothetical protein